MENQRLNKSYDVIIAGAGPSGTTLGYLLSDKGLDVLVIDKEEFPRPKLCGGAITWKTRKLLERLFKISFEKQFQVERTSSDYFIYENFKQKVHQVSPEPFYFINREKYDMEWISLAMSKNCQFLFGLQVTDLDVRKKIILTKLGNTYGGKVVVGADGINSVIRRKIFPQKIFEHDLAFAFQINVPPDRLKTEYQISSPRIFLGGIRGGYGWIFPHKKHYVVGICGLIRKNKKLKERFHDFLKDVSALEIEKKSRIPSHLGPLGNFMETPGEENILLVGDAAGFADPLTGEGIYYAHKSAELASRAILDFFNSEEKMNPLERYKYYLQPVYRELKISKRLRNLAYSRSRKLAHVVFNSPKFYLKLAETVHGIRSYTQIPLLSKWIKVNSSL